MKKKIMAFTLALCMAAAGCSAPGNESAGEQEGTAAVTDADTGQAEQTGTDEQPDQAAQTGQEPYTVVVVAAGDATDESCRMISEEVSRITLEKFNTTVELVRYGFGEYIDQTQLMLASGEKIDLMASLNTNTSTAAQNGQLLPLDDLLREYGTEMYEQISQEEWDCSTVEGQIYGVRNNKELACGYGIAMLTEVLETLDTDYTQIKTEADLEPLLREVKEKYPDMYPMVSDFGSMGTWMNSIDWLGRDFGVLLDAASSDTTVVNWWTSEPYLESCRIRHRWVEEGLIMPDPTINSETAVNLMAAGKAFCIFTDTKPGIEGQFERNTGKDITVLEVVSPFTITSNLNNLWFIPYTSEQPERAMQVLNEMYMNPDLSNLFINGVEGVHYQIVDKASGIIDYPDGEDSSSIGYATATWMWPNELISYKWLSDGADIWTDTQIFNQEAIVSPAKGFVWDNTSVSSEIAACMTLLEKYQDGLDTGELDPDVVIPRMEEEFKAAGVEKILEEKQRQLDEWLAGRQ